MHRLRALLLSIVEGIDGGRFKALSESDIVAITDMVKVPKAYNTTEAYTYLGISRSRFYELRHTGVIPEPTTNRGSNVKMYAEENLRKLKLESPEKLYGSQ